MNGVLLGKKVGQIEKPERQNIQNWQQSREFETFRKKWRAYKLLPMRECNIMVN
jgi:hypothetical protein